MFSVLVDLNPKFSEAIEKHWPAQSFQNSFEVIYQGHSPNVAFFLKSGECILGPEEEALIKEVKGAAVVGLSELMAQKPAQVTVKIQKGAVASLFDRADFFEKMRLDSNLVDLYRSLVNFDNNKNNYLKG